MTHEYRFGRDVKAFKFFFPLIISWTKWKWWLNRDCMNILQD